MATRKERLQMAYLDTRRRPDPTSMAAVVGIHLAVGATLVFGLTVTGVIPDHEIIDVFDVPKPTPPPPKPPEPQPTASQSAQPKLFVPVPPIPLPTREPELGTTTELFPKPGPSPLPGPSIGPDPLPSVTPSFTPIGASPRNDPKRWVSTDDYRGNWIRQELTGKARFRLEIAADGRVSGCTITGSSGHPELDAATCALVSKRAKFQPARGDEGQPVAGSYSNAIDWQLPE